MRIVAATHRVFKHILFAAWHEFLRGSGKPQSCCAAASICYMPLGSAPGSSTALKCLLSLPISLCFVDACCVIGSTFAISTADPLSKAGLHNVVAGLYSLAKPSLLLHIRSQAATVKWYCHQ